MLEETEMIPQSMIRTPLYAAVGGSSSGAAARLHAMRLSIISDRTAAVSVHALMADTLRRLFRCRFWVLPPNPPPPLVMTPPPPEPPPPPPPEGPRPPDGPLGALGITLVT